MPPTVVDSTCLIALERIGRLDILSQLFSDIVAPPAVAEEFGSSLAWMTVRAGSNDLSTAALRTQLHRGEAEAIALAAEIEADRIVLDDKKAPSDRSRAGAAPHRNGRCDSAGKERGYQSRRVAPCWTR